MDKGMGHQNAKKGDPSPNIEFLRFRNESSAQRICKLAIYGNEMEKIIKISFD
jgi:hypothetical protein